MRTTVEIEDKHWARLLELAAKRREKGVSGVLAEAIDTYLAAVEQHEANRRAALRRLPGCGKPGDDRRAVTSPGCLASS